MRLTTETEAISAVAQYKFEDVAMLPSPSDNCAMAKRLLSTGTRIITQSGMIVLHAPCLEGHRFAIERMARGKPLLSWGLPFGHATVPFRPGDVLLNQKAADALRGRLQGASAHHDLVETSAIRELLANSAVNFEDLDVTPDSPFILEEHGFHAVGMNQPNVTQEGTFLGYRRPHGRGVGTRNHVAVIALTASASSLIASFQARWSHYLETTTNFDGVRIVAHTEGESSGDQKNELHIHRCLAGFVSHMNLGAVVVVTTGLEQHITRETLLHFVEESNKIRQVYPAECFKAPYCQFVQLTGETSGLGVLDGAVKHAVSHATDRVQRKACALSELCLALQCGGSDSFSGLTGNPLAGEVAGKFILDHASSAILAESPELVGAEPYILSRVGNESVAKDFIRTTEHYKAYGARHGLSVAGNPSGGNLYRGLYNIVLKSLGAARKKPPNIALDAVLEYGEPIMCRRESKKGPPYYAFMDSPGNDLESIAGQVASGANLIIFITGNGAMTNFPFVPTVKVVTTSKRYELLQHEMDVNGEPYGNGGMERIKAVQNGFDLCVRIASGERSKGEAAGHSQVSIWRNWAVGEDVNNKKYQENTKTESMGTDELLLCTKEEPHQVRPDPPPLPTNLLQLKPIKRIQHACGTAVALIPTSLCSSAVAASFKSFIQKKVDGSVTVVCPSHTEGCGAAGDSTYERRYQRLMIGHAVHPSISRAIFLEHGCEKTHNDYFRNCLREADVTSIEEDIESYFAFWSLQRDGGYENAKKKVVEYLSQSQPKKECNNRLFGIPWSDRPIAVGLLIGPNMISSFQGSLLATAMGSAVRFLSQLHVHSVIPDNSPLVSGRTTDSPGSKAGRPVVNVGDIEDLFSGMPPASEPDKKDFSERQTACHVFAAETLVDATAPKATLLAGQMINQAPQKTLGGLHVMEIPEGASWDETVSCLGPACDMMLLVADANEISLLPSSCIAPTLRCPAPRPDDWHQWTVETCSAITRVLLSPLIVGSDSDGEHDTVSLQRSLFSATTFVVPRGPTAVSF